MTPATPLFEPPNGMYPARVDDKGRLKLPVGFQQYFAGLPEKKLFVTSLDRRIGNIYLNSVWRKNQQFFSENRGLAAESKRIAFNAQDLGSDSEMDAQGRILYPNESVYFPFIYSSDGTIRLSYPVRRLENLAPGSYVFAVDGGARKPFEVREGGSTVVSLP